MRQLPVGGIGRVIVARKARWKTYLDECPTCGKETDWSVKTRACLVCQDGDATPARVLARRANKKTYWGTCEKHGGVQFATRTGLCLRCFRTDGQERTPKSARAIARSANRHKFLAYCDHHGAETEHWVTNGKCSVCYNAMGMPRPLTSRQATGEHPSLELVRILSELHCPAVVFSELVGVRVTQVFRWMSSVDSVPDYVLLIARTLTPELVREQAHYPRS